MATIAASTVVTPTGLIEPGIVDVADGRIVSVRKTSTPGPDRVLVPGFVDIQVNGVDDVDVREADGDAWARLDDLLVAQGTTTWCPTLVTAPLHTYAAPLARITAAGQRPAHRRAAIAGAHLEGPFLGGAPGAHPRDLIVPVDLSWLRELPPVVKVLTLAPESPGARAAIATLVDRGIVVSLGHSTASYAEALQATSAGARLVTHVFNGMGPFHHREPGLVGAALSDHRLTVSLIADGIHVHPAAIGATFAAKGREGVVLVTDSVAWRAGRVGRAAIELADGAPRLHDGTLAGSALTMDGAIRTCVERAGVPLLDAVTAATTTPASLLALHDRGRIEPGARADLVALSPTLHVDQVWIGGDEVHTI